MNEFIRIGVDRFSLASNLDNQSSIYDTIINNPATHTVLNIILYIRVATDKSGKLSYW